MKVIRKNKIVRSDPERKSQWHAFGKTLEVDLEQVYS